jgi:hypothetical protein
MKRRWFQIHLSTAIVMMFAASGLLWLNLRLVRATHPELIEFGPSSRTWIETRGWPYAVCIREAINSYSFDGPFKETGVEESTHWNAAWQNALVALITLIVIAFCAECFIRRERSCLPAETKDVGL